MLFMRLQNCQVSHLAYVKLTILHIVGPWVEAETSLSLTIWKAAKTHLKPASKVQQSSLGWFNNVAMSKCIIWTLKQNQLRTAVDYRTALFIAGLLMQICSIKYQTF